MPKKNPTILVTGGSGLLGSEIRKLEPSVIAPTHAEMDVLDIASVEKALKKYKPQIVIHAAAAMRPPEHETDPIPGLTVNIQGTVNMARVCHDLSIRLVYTSTDYIYKGDGPHLESEPVLGAHKFAWSKLGGECAVRLLTNSLILRLSFGPVPFPWEKVYENQTNSKLYVDEIAPLVLQAALSEAIGVLNIGGPRTTLEEYAKRTRPDIKTIPLPEWAPQDTSLELGKMRDTLSIKNLWSVLKHGNKKNS